MNLFYFNFFTKDKKLNYLIINRNKSLYMQKKYFYMSNKQI